MATERVSEVTAKKAGDEYPDEELSDPHGEGTKAVRPLPTAYRTAVIAIKATFDDTVWGRTFAKSVVVAWRAAREYIRIIYK